MSEIKNKSMGSLVEVSPKVNDIFQSLMSNAAVKQALEGIKKDDAQALQELIKMSEVPAPPFKEAKRAEYLKQKFIQLGQKDAYIDAEGNVIAVRKGTDPTGPVFVVSGHIDTVFPEGTDVTVKERDGKLYGPGLSDNTRGVMDMLAMLKVMNENKLQTVGDVMFVGTVGEEGEGDLRGVKALFKEHKNIAGFISIDNEGMGNVVSQATGSHRYEVVFSGPGGHSFLAFGEVPSATHALGRAITKIGDLQVPKSPKTTFTVGVVSGGESINAIAAKASLKLDLRSNDNEHLLALEKQAIEAINTGVAEENARWNSKEKITVEFNLIGNRPAGMPPQDSAIIQAQAAALQNIGLKLEKLETASTDANVPMSLGIPSLTVGKGGECGEIHSLGEWYVHKDAYKGGQNALLLTLSLAGLDGVCKPLLEPR